MAAGKDSGLSPDPVVGRSIYFRAVVEAPCRNLAQSGVTSHMQETAGEKLQLALVVCICASFRMAVGLVGETLQQFAAWRLFLHYLFFLRPVRPNLHPKLLQRGPGEGSTPSSPGSLLCHSWPSFLCPVPWAALGLCGRHAQHGGHLSRLWTTTGLQKASLLAEHSRKPCLPQPLVLSPSCPLARGTWLSACCPCGHLHRCTPKLLCQHPLTL